MFCAHCKAQCFLLRYSQGKGILTEISTKSEEEKEGIAMMMSAPFIELEVKSHFTKKDANTAYTVREFDRSRRAEQARYSRTRMMIR